VAAGVSDHIWKIEEIIALLGYPRSMRESGRALARWPSVVASRRRLRALASRLGAILDFPQQHPGGGGASSSPHFDSRGLHRPARCASPSQLKLTHYPTPTDVEIVVVGRARDRT